MNRHLEDKSFIGFMLDKLKEMYDDKDLQIFRDSMPYVFLDATPSKKYIEMVYLSEFITPTLDMRIIKSSKAIDEIVQKSIQIFFKIRLSINGLDMIKEQIKKMEEKKDFSNIKYKYKELQLQYGKKLHEDIQLHNELKQQFKLIKVWHDLILGFLTQKGMSFIDFFKYREKNRQKIEDEEIEGLAKAELVRNDLKLQSIDEKKIPYVIEYLSKLKNKKTGGKNNERTK